MHHYISLGAACNAATMMKNAGLRKASFPFDWLLNLNAGLSAVTSIIEDDFKKVTAEDCYKVTYHPPVCRAVPAYKDYPNTFHIHSDPAADPEIHREMVRRFERFRTVLRSSDTLHFVYYRNLSACRDENPNSNAIEAAGLMVAEANRFLSAIKPVRRGKTFLLLVLECDVEDTDTVDQAIQHIQLQDSRVSLARAISRYDDDADLKARWQQEWTELIINRTKMPLLLQLRCRCKRAIRALRKSIKTKKLKPLAGNVSQTART